MLDNARTHKVFHHYAWLWHGYVKLCYSQIHPLNTHNISIFWAKEIFQGGPPLVRSQLVRISLVRIFKKLSWNSTCTILYPNPPVVRIQLTRFCIKILNYYEMQWYTVCSSFYFGTSILNILLFENTNLIQVGCWLFDHVIYLKLRWKQMRKLKKYSYFHSKWNCWPFWLKIIVIFWIYSDLITVNFFSAWHKSRDTRAKSQRMEQM